MLRCLCRRVPLLRQEAPRPRSDYIHKAHHQSHRPEYQVPIIVRRCRALQQTLRGAVRTRRRCCPLFHSWVIPPCVLCGHGWYTCSTLMPTALWLWNDVVRPSCVSIPFQYGGINGRHQCPAPKPTDMLETFSESDDHLGKCLTACAACVLSPTACFQMFSESAPPGQ